MIKKICFAIILLSMLSIPSFSADIPERVTIYSQGKDICNPLNEDEYSITIWYEDENADGYLNNWQYGRYTCQPEGAITKVNWNYTVGRADFALDPQFVGQVSIKIQGCNDGFNGGWGELSNAVTYTVRTSGEEISQLLNGPLTVLEGKSYRYSIVDENMKGYYIKVVKNYEQLGFKWLQDYDSGLDRYYGNLDFSNSAYPGDLSLRVHGRYVCGLTDDYTELAVHVVGVPKNIQSTSGKTTFQSGETAEFAFDNLSQKTNVIYQWSVSPSTLAEFQETGDKCTIKFTNTSGQYYTIKCRAIVDNNQYGDWSEEIKVVAKESPKVSEVLGPENVCYSNITKVLHYQVKGTEGQVQWEITGNNAQLESSGRKAQVTINENTGSFTLRARINNGFITSPATAKTVNVTNTNATVNFGDITPCSGQGDILLTDISPAGGFYFVHGRERTETFYASHYHYKRDDNIHYVETGNMCHYGEYYDSNYENIIAFAGYNNNIPSENIISARLIIHMNNPGINIRGRIGSLTSQASDRISAAEYENLKSNLSFEIDDKEIMNNSALEIDVTEIVRNWDYKQLYLDPQSYVINGANFYTNNNIDALKPKLVITYTTAEDMLINTNTPGASYQISYVNDEGGCTSIGQTTIRIDPKPNLSFSPGSYCAEQLPVTLAGGSSNMDGVGRYIADNIVNNQLVKSAAGSHPVTYQFTADNGCKNEITRNITVYPTPNPAINSLDNLCAGNPINTRIDGSFSAINWNINGTSFVGSSASYTPVAGYFGNITARATVTDYHGCSNTLSKDIYIYELPIVNLDDQQICTGNYTIYEADASISTGYLEYQWSNGQSGRDLKVTVNSTQSYSVTVTSLNGCSATDQMQMIALENPSFTVEDKTACQGENVTLIAEPFRDNWSYQWSNNRVGNQIVYTPTQTGSNTVNTLVTDNDNGCKSFVGSEVYVYENPQFTLQDQDACYGVQTQVFAPPGYTQYLWSNGSTGSSSIVITPYSSQTISCEVEDNNGCKSTESMRLSVHTPTPFSLEQINDKIFCYGSTATIFGPEGYDSYLWSNGSHNQSISFAHYSPGSYSLTTSDIHGCQSQDDIYLEVRQLPSISINSPTICQGEQATLVATPSSYELYYWDNGQSGSTNVVNPNVNTTYRVNVTDDLGCINSFSTEVNVNPLPYFSLADQAVCYGENLTLSVPEGFSSYLWSTGESSSSIDLVANESGNYSCQVTNAYGCSAEKQMLLSVRQPMELSMEDINACQGESVQLIAPNGFRYYNWSNGVEYQSTWVEANQTTNYTLDVLDQNGCSNTSTFTLFANPYPIVDMQDVGINQGQQRSIDAPGGYAGYLWSTGHTSESIVVSPQEDTQYWVEITTDKDCSRMDTFLVYVYDLPQITLEDVAVCLGEQVALEAPEGYISYSWRVGEMSYSDRVITIKPESTIMAYLEVENQYGGIGGTSLEIRVNQIPTITCKDTLICYGDQLWLSTQAGYLNYNWSSGQTGASILVSPEINTRYQLEVQAQNGCSNQKEISVAVDNPASEFSASMSLIHMGDPVQFAVNNPINGNSYSWNLGDGSSATGSSVIHYYYNEGIYDISLLTESINGCNATTTKQGYIQVSADNLSVGTNQEDSPRILIYPNPVSRILYIELADFEISSNINITLYTVNGKEVLQDNMFTKLLELDVSTLKPGVYFLKIKSDKYSIIKKLIHE